MKRMKLTAYGKTDVGLKRENNEDCFLIDEQLGLFVVCDGMGGHAAGEVASQGAAQAVAEYLRDHHAELIDAGSQSRSMPQIEELAEDAVEEASVELCELSEHSEKLAGMGTTLSMLLVQGDRGVIAHVGDSRVYLKRDDRIRLLTRDHTMANEMVAAGTMKPEVAECSRLAHVLTRSLGRDVTSDVDTRTVELQAGDCVLLCSDGLSNYFDSDEEVAELLSEECLADVPERLIEFAKSRGGVDNITAIVVRWENEATQTTQYSDDKLTRHGQDFID